jgi:23S rRNA (uracil1939-C5)-methyltransferase
MFCPHVHECGGCRFQQTDYSLQLEQKQAVVADAFKPHAVNPIIPCQDPWRYRNKMEFSFSQNKAGDRFLGLILKGSRGKVFNLNECLIVSPWFAKTVGSIREWWAKTDLKAYHFHKGEGSLRTLILREGKRTGDKMAMLTVSGDPRFALKRAEIDAFIAAIGDPSVSLFLRIQQCLKGSPTQFYEMHLQGPAHIREELSIHGRRLSFLISPTSFFQPNTLQAEVLYAAALSLIEPQGHVFDLYAGTATIGMILAQKAEKVTAVELNPHAVFDAKANAELNGISNLEIICGDVGKALNEINAKPDLVVVDPPRAGLDAAALQHLERLQPRQILYVSCNPATQAANIAALSEYRIAHVQPVDQFPHTPHIENIVLLERKSFF